MKPTGFSTGALARGNFRAAASWISSTNSDAIELSALRINELEPLMFALRSLDLRQFTYKSIHAPKSYREDQEQQIVDSLLIATQQGFRVVLHPDAIHDIGLWGALGDMLCLENMDMRKRIGRTADEMESFFLRLPEARFCFDIGHARQVDPSMAVAYELIERFGDRIAHLHVSEVDTAGSHWAMSTRCLMAFERLVSTLCTSFAVIIESQVLRNGIDKELDNTRQSISRSNT